MTLQLPKGHLSPSQVDSFFKCGEQYRFIHVEGFRRPPDFFLAAHRQTHATILEFDLKHKAETGHNKADSELSEHYRDAMEKSVPELKDAHDLEEGIIPTIEKEVKYFDKIITATKPFREATTPAKTAAGIPRIEEKLEFSMGTVPVVAYLDLVADRTVFDQILDLKRRGKTPHSGLASKSRQLATYAQGTGIGDVGFRTIVENKTPTLHEDDGTITQGRIERAVIQYEAAAEAISAGRFVPIDDGDPMKEWVCSAKWCGFWSKDATDWVSGKPAACRFGERAAVSVALGG